MIAYLSTLISPRLSGVSGKAFCSGREAFRRTGGIYVLGYNPGGDPLAHSLETVSAHTGFVLTSAPDLWSAYLDEFWQGRGSVMQARMQHLFRGLALDPRLVPSSNLVFARSRRGDALGPEAHALIDLCWPFHRAAIDGLGPQAIICLGSKCARVVRQKIGGEMIDAFSENYGARSWSSYAWRKGNGPVVIQITHPSRADWTNPAADPIPMVKRVMKLLQ